MSNVVRELQYQARYGLPIWLITVLTSFFPDIGISIRLRGFLVSCFLPGRPKGLTLGRDVTLLSANKLIIGKSVYIAKGCWINAIGTVTICNEVALAPYVVMSSTNHGFLNDSVKQGGAHPAPISIGAGSWIAAHSVIGSGVSVGKGNIIGANSVVTKSTQDNGIFAGVPAVFIKKRIDNPSAILSKHDVE